MNSSQPQRNLRQAGFTLIELMVALALSLVLAIALLVMQVNLGKNTMRTADVGVRDVQARAAMDLITQDISDAGFLFGGTALFLATFGYTRWMMFHTWATTRLTATAVVLLLLPLARLLPALAAIFLLALVVVALNVAEYVRVARGKRLEAVPEQA